MWIVLFRQRGYCQSYSFVTIHTALDFWGWCYTPARKAFPLYYTPKIDSIAKRPMLNQLNMIYLMKKTSLDWQLPLDASTFAVLTQKQLKQTSKCQIRWLWLLYILTSRWLKNVFSCFLWFLPCFANFCFVFKQKRGFNDGKMLQPNAGSHPKAGLVPRDFFYKFGPL